MGFKQGRRLVGSEMEIESETMFSDDGISAIRILTDCGSDGYVRIQELEFADGVGWYIQRSVVVPHSALNAVANALRKAKCIMVSKPVSVPFMRLVESKPEQGDKIRRSA